MSNIITTAVQRICESCTLPIGNVFISTGTGGVMHPRCFYRSYHYVAKTTFRQVLWNMDDQVLVRQLLDAYVDEAKQQHIIAAFNRLMTERHREKLARYEKDAL